MFARSNALRGHSHEENPPEGLAPLDTATVASLHQGCWSKHLGDENQVDRIITSLALFPTHSRPTLGIKPTTRNDFRHRASIEKSNMSPEILDGFNIFQVYLKCKESMHIETLLACSAHQAMPIPPKHPKFSRTLPLGILKIR